MIMINEIGDGVLEEFNKATSVFLKALLLMQPTILEFKLIRIGFKVIKKLNAKLPLALWRATVEDPYESYIISRDDSFFVNAAFEAPNDYSLLYRKMVPMLVDVWIRSSDNDKNTVWEHLQRLLNLSKKCRQHNNNI